MPTVSGCSGSSGSDGEGWRGRFNPAAPRLPIRRQDDEWKGGPFCSRLDPMLSPSPSTPLEAAQQVAAWRLRSGARSQTLLCSLFTITERRQRSGVVLGEGGLGPLLPRCRVRVCCHDCLCHAVTAASHQKHHFFSPPLSVPLSLLFLFHFTPTSRSPLVTFKNSTREHNYRQQLRRRNTLR